ncbi:MAG: hypothetical protein GX210_02825 [Firmicutes bacterium]|nr:hypothetical protein [Bacillota bacterium]
MLMKKFCIQRKKNLATGLLTAAADLGAEAAAFAFDEKMARALLEYGPAKVYIIDGTDRPESYARAMADFLLEMARTCSWWGPRPWVGSWPLPWLRMPMPP